MAFAPGDPIFACKLDFGGWTFDKGMKKGNGVFKSEPFEIRGLPWQFYLRMSKTMLRYPVTTSDEEDYEQDKDDSIGWYSPRELTINGVQVKPISNYFSVQLCVENPEVMEPELKKLELCGTLAMYQTSAGHRYPGDTITGVMFRPTEDYPFEAHQREITTGYLKFGHYGPQDKRPEFNGWFFGTEIPTLTDTKTPDLVYTTEPDVHRDFYTVGKVPRLVVQLTIGIPSKFKKIFEGLA